MDLSNTYFLFRSSLRSGNENETFVGYRKVPPYGYVYMLKGIGTTFEASKVLDVPENHLGWLGICEPTFSWRDVSEILDPVPPPASERE